MSDVDKQRVRMLQQLCSFGFFQKDALEALVATNFSGVEDAVLYLQGHHRVESTPQTYSPGPKARAGTYVADAAVHRQPVYGRDTYDDVHADSFSNYRQGNGNSAENRAVKTSLRLSTPTHEASSGDVEDQMRARMLRQQQRAFTTSPATSSTTPSFDNLEGVRQHAATPVGTDSNSRTVLSANFDTTMYNRVYLRVSSQSENNNRYSYEMEATSVPPQRPGYDLDSPTVSNKNRSPQSSNGFQEPQSPSPQVRYYSPGASRSVRPTTVDVHSLCAKVDNMLARRPSRGRPDELRMHTGTRDPFPHSPSRATVSSTTSTSSSYDVIDQSPYARSERSEQLSPTTTDESVDTPMDDYIRCVSPLPESIHSKLKEGTFETCVKPVMPKAFRFFMEQHVENVIKQHRERQKRMMQLSRELSNVGLPPQVHCGMRKLLMQKESQYLRQKRQHLDQSMFVKIKTIGQGAFGDVLLVRKKDTKLLYAMKILKKSDVIRKNQAAHVKAERDILSEADNEWVVKLFYSFQDSNNLFFILEYIPGGDLMALLIKRGIFEESLAKFYVAELVMAIDSVHKLKFIHRDIKPDNILIDKDGHIKLTDFGLCTGFRWTHQSKYYRDHHPHSHEVQDSFDQLATDTDSSNKLLDYRREKHLNRQQAHSLVGTPNYIAPEVLQRIGHTQACDWWSVGVILYEMLVGCPPFQADTPEHTQYKIIGWRHHLYIPPQSQRPMSSDAKNLILCLCRDVADRLGTKGGAAEVKDHPWFEDVDFVNLRKKQAPFRPAIRHETDTSNFDTVPSESERQFDLSKSTDVPADHAFYEFTFRRFFEPDGHGCPTLRIDEKMKPRESRR